MRKFLDNLTGFDVLSLCVLIMVATFGWAMFAASSKADFECEVRRSGSATLNNGNVVVVAEVVEIDDEADEVVVKIGRDLYAFCGDGFAEGERILCEMTPEHDKIIDVWE